MNKTFSVLMFCPQFSPVLGGAERQAEKLSSALVRKGCRVTLLTPRIDLASPSFEKQEGVQIHRYNLFDLSKATGVRGLGPANLIVLRYQTMRALSRLTASHDVLHAHIISPLSAFAVEAAYAAGLPTMCKVAMAGARNDFTELGRLGLGSNFISRSLRRKLDCYIATSEAIRSDLLASGIAPERIELIPNGVDLGEAEPWTRKASRFLYLGRLSTNIERDVPGLLAAFDKVADRHPDAELAVVGGGDLLESTAQLVKRLKYAHKVLLPGTQPAADWLRWADFFVLPSRREGLSNALLEAMSFGLPCIANDIPPNREALDHGRCGLLVPVSGINQLVSAMSALVENDQLAQSLSRNASRHVTEVYAMPNVADQHIANYARLIKAQRQTTA